MDNYEVKKLRISKFYKTHRLAGVAVYVSALVVCILSVKNNVRVYPFRTFTFLIDEARQSPMTAVKKGTGGPIAQRGQPAEPGLFLATEFLIVAEL